MPAVNEQSTLVFIWFTCIVILIVLVFIIGMLYRMWRHEWREPGNDFYRRHGIDSDK